MVVVYSFTIEELVYWLRSFQICFSTNISHWVFPLHCVPDLLYLEILWCGKFRISSIYSLTLKKQWCKFTFVQHPPTLWSIPTISSFFSPICSWFCDVNVNFIGWRRVEEAIKTLLAYKIVILWDFYREHILRILKKNICRMAVWLSGDKMYNEGIRKRAIPFLQEFLVLFCFWKVLGCDRGRMIRCE